MAENVSTGGAGGACGVERLRESSGIGVEALVEVELVLETGRERKEEASAAVLVFAPTVMRVEVVEGETDAEVQDLVSSAVGRAGVGFEVRGAEDEALALSSVAGFGSPLQDIDDGGMSDAFMPLLGVGWICG